MVNVNFAEISCRIIHMIPQAAEIFNFVGTYYGQYGAAIIFFGSLLENLVIIGTILPGSTIITLGGFYAQTGNLPIVYVLIWGFVGTFLASQANYFIGRNFFHLIKKADIAKRRFEQIEKRLEGHLGEVAFLFYFVPAIRTIAMAVAGAVRLPYHEYLFISFIGSLIWSAGFIFLGYFLGQNRALLEQVIDGLGVGLVLLVAVYVFLKYQYLKRRKK